jgi:hypothetical protein
MNEIADTVNGGLLPAAPEDGLENRLFRIMIGAVALAVLIGGVIAPWRVTAGLLLGGLLSLLNHHWLRSSIAAVFAVEKAGKRPRVKVWRYILRYFVIGAVAFAAYKLQIVSLPAMIAGLCSFVVALLVEAFRQFYFAIIHREETY